MVLLIYQDMPTIRPLIHFHIQLEFPSKLYVRCVVIYRGILLYFGYD